jgi:D-xylose transport system substrate-binding protein
MKKSTTLYLFLAIALLWGAVSCTSNGDAKVGFLLPNLDINRYQKEMEFFSTRVKELGGEAVVVSADNLDEKQIAQASEMIQEGVKVLVINSVNQNTAAAIVREARASGVKVIAYDRLIRSEELDYYLSFDNVKVGKMMAEQAVKARPSGKYILLGGDKGDQNAIYVKSGQLEVLAPYIERGEIEIVYDIYVEDWSGDNAGHEIRKFLNLSPFTPDVILSSYDGMSTAAIKELTEKGLEGQVIVTGQDAELEACRNIYKGIQLMTVYKPVKNLAEMAADMAVSLAKGTQSIDSNETIEVLGKKIPAILLEPIVVHKDNLKETVIADGFHDENSITSP